jgi:hypothetical protein
LLIPSASTVPKFIVKSGGLAPAVMLHCVPLVNVSRIAFTTLTLTANVEDTVFVFVASLLAKTGRFAVNAIAIAQTLHRIFMSNPFSFTNYR